jgi:hypothetical protein
MKISKDQRRSLPLPAYSFMGEVSQVGKARDWGRASKDSSLTGGRILSYDLLKGKKR